MTPGFSFYPSLSFLSRCLLSSFPGFVFPPIIYYLLQKCFHRSFGSHYSKVPLVSGPRHPKRESLISVGLTLKNRGQIKNQTNLNRECFSWLSAKIQNVDFFACGADVSAPDLSFSHHVFIRLQVESKGFSHLSYAIEQHLHVHHMLLVPLFELNI